MTLVSIPSNPVPEDVVSGTIKTPDGAELRFARWAPPAGRKGTVCVFTGRSEQIEKYFETVRDLRDRGFAVAMIDWRGQGHSSRRLRDPRKGYVRDFSDFEVDVETFVQQVVLPDCPPPYFALAHSMGGAVMLRIARAGKRWFDRMVLSAPMIDLPGRATSLPVRMLVKTLRWAGQGGRYVPGGGDQLTGAESFVNNPLTSDPVRYARNAAILEEDPGLADHRLGGRRLLGDARLSRHELPLGHPPADPDAGGKQRHHRVDRGDRGIRLSFARRLASRHCRRQARDPAGAGPLPRPVLGGVRRLRAGHAAVQVGSRKS
jgi:alpha-beta hydrolase superfamily lysophospholipase